MWVPRGSCGGMESGLGVICRKSPLENISSGESESFGDFGVYLWRQENV